MSLTFVSVSLHLTKLLIQKHLDIISWPKFGQRCSNKNLISRFPHFWFLWMEKKCCQYRPDSEGEQRVLFDAYKKFQCWTITCYTDILERFVCLELCDDGTNRDSLFYIGLEIYSKVEELLDNGHHGIIETIYIESRDSVVPFMENQSTMRMYRTEYNCDIYKQKIVTEWEFDHIKNLLCIFLGQWSFSVEPFEMINLFYARLVSCCFVRKGYQLHRAEQYTESSNSDDTGFVFKWSLHTTASTSHQAILGKQWSVWLKRERLPELLLFLFERLAHSKFVVPIDFFSNVGGKTSCSLNQKLSIWRNERHKFIHLFLWRLCCETFTASALPECACAAILTFSAMARCCFLLFLSGARLFSVIRTDAFAGLVFCACINTMFEPS